MSAAQLALFDAPVAVSAEPLPAASAVAPGSTTSAAKLLLLADAAASSDWTTVEAHLRRAAALLDGSDAWAARPYLVALFLGTAWDRRYRRRQARGDKRFDRGELEESKAQLLLVAVGVVRRIRQIPAPELAVEELPEGGSGLARWHVEARSPYWPALASDGAWVTVERFPSGVLRVELQVLFPDQYRTQFIDAGRRLVPTREPAMALLRARRLAALGAALLRAQAAVTRAEEEGEV